MQSFTFTEMNFMELLYITVPIFCASAISVGLVIQSHINLYFVSIDYNYLTNKLENVENKFDEFSKEIMKFSSTYKRQKRETLKSNKFLGCSCSIATKANASCPTGPPGPPVKFL